MPRSDVFIPCGTITLEGILEIPERPRSVPAAVICHPHPLYGGTMHNTVVKTLRKTLLERGYACLRFNFRGVGKSWGTHGNGITEEEDVLAALDFVAARPEVEPTKLLVAGYSFGCWVGLKAAVRDARPRRLVGISPPADLYDFSFLSQEHRPLMLVAGDRDFVCSLEEFRNLVSRIPEPRYTRVLPGVDHFHVGTEHNLVTELTAFLDKNPW